MTAMPPDGLVESGKIAPLVGLKLTIGKRMSPKRSLAEDH